jgi:hypothetical protein
MRTADGSYYRRLLQWHRVRLPFTWQERNLKPGYAAQLLIAFPLITMVPVAMGILESLPNESNSGAAVTEPTETSPTLESRPIMPTTGSRSQLLYENYCQRWHISIVHVRDAQRARSLKDLEYWVARWSNELKLQWSADEICDVVDYLNRRYYKIAVPPSHPH